LLTDVLNDDIVYDDLRRSLQGQNEAFRVVATTEHYYESTYILANHYSRSSIRYHKLLTQQWQQQFLWPLYRSSTDNWYLQLRLDWLFSRVLWPVISGMGFYGSNDPTVTALKEVLVSGFNATRSTSPCYNTTSRNIQRYTKYIHCESKKRVPPYPWL